MESDFSLYFKIARLKLSEIHDKFSSPLQPRTKVGSFSSILSISVIAMFLNAGQDFSQIPGGRMSLNESTSHNPASQDWVPGDEGLDPNRWRALFVIAIASLMIVLDASIINLALPSAQKALHISDPNRQWIVTAYSLAFGSLLLLGGRIADYVGRKRIFVIGLIGFAVASAIGGFATNQGELFAMRGLQGAFGALLAPASLSLINVTFKVPKERAVAFGVYGGISGGGAAVGLILGGLLTEYANWRWCLFVNAPIALFAVALALPYLHESKAEGENTYDIPGAVSVTLGLVSLVYGFSQAASQGWANLHTYAYFIIAAFLLIAFFITETRVKQPLLPMRVLAERNRAGSYIGSLLVGVGLFAMFLFLSIYMQQFLHYSPLRSGFAFLPFTAGIVIGAGVASQLLPRIGPRPLMVVGMLLATVGILLFSRITPTSGYLSHLLVPMIIMSFGCALYFIPNASTGLHDAGEHDAGIASATLNTAQQIGGSLGAALLNTIAISSASAYVRSHKSMGDSVQIYAQVHGFTTTFIWGAGFLFVCAVISALMISVGKDSIADQLPAGAI
jgi:EmrB/QacA subfamily drug resistance transporter